MLNFLKAAPDAITKVAPEAIKKTYLKRQFGVLIATCVGYISYYIIRLVFTVQQQEIMHVYGFSKGDVGMVLACFGIGYGISKLFMGALADKSNLRFYLAAGLMLSSILNIFLGSTQNLYIMMFLMVLMAVTQGMGAPSCQKLVQVWWSKKYKGVIYSIWSSAHNAGAFFCVAAVELAAFFFGKDNVSAAFYTASAISAVIAVLIVVIGSDRPASVGLPSVAEYNNETVVLHDGSKVADDKTHHTLVEIFVKYILQNKVVWIICLTSMSLYIIRYGVMSWIPSYLSEAKGFDKSWAKWLVGIFEIAAVPGVILLGAASDAIKGKRAPVCLACMSILAICLGIYIFGTDHTMIIIALIVMGNMIYAPITLVGLMVNEAVPKFAVGSSTGFMGFFQYIIGEICATAVIGIAVDNFGWAGQNVIIVSAIVLASCLMLYLIVVELRREKHLKKEATLEVIENKE